MKIEKKSKGWIIEELEKKNECLDANSFGGENPEDVEKQREENAKEINKRFKKTIENCEKVVGEDHVELSKTIKESKDFKKEERKEMGAFIEELKSQNIKPIISRSANEEFRWNVSYDKLVEEVVEESKGGFVKKYRKCSIIETPSVFVCTDPHGTTIGESKTIPGCEGVIDAWCERHGIKESIEDTIVDCLVAFGVCDNEEEAKERVARMSEEQKHNWLNSFSHQSKERLIVDSLQEDANELGRRLGKKLLPPKEESKVFDIYWFETKDCLGDAIHKEFKSEEEANKWHEEHHKDEDKFNMSDVAMIEESLEEDLLTLDEPQETLNEDLPDVIPEEPIVVSTEVPSEEVVVDEVVPEVVDNGIYLALSSELRDILQDIENLKGLTVTLASEEGKEDIIDELNAIIDDRTIHTGIIQGLMEKVDTKVEPVEEVEVPTEE